MDARNSYKYNANTIVSGTNIVLLNQTYASARADSGDSGSPVFKITNNPQQYDIQLLGILGGAIVMERRSFYSPMSGIKNELGQIQTTPIIFINGTVKDNSQEIGSLV